jgi:hypothetical protein
MAGPMAFKTGDKADIKVRCTYRTLCLSSYFSYSHIKCNQCLKGLGHRTNKFNSVTFVQAQMVFIFLLVLIKRKVNVKFMLASLKALTNDKDCSETRIKFLFRLSFSLIGRFSAEYIHIRLSKQFSGSQAAFRETCRVTGGYQKVGTSFLESGFSQSLPIINFIEASRNFCEFCKKF